MYLLLRPKAFYKGVGAVLPARRSSHQRLGGSPGNIHLRRDTVSRVSELAKVRVMAQGEVPSPPEQEGEEECLHCAIVALVEARIAAGGADAADLAALVVESLVDLILRVPE